MFELVIALGYHALNELSRGLSRGLSRDNVVFAGLSRGLLRVFLGPLRPNHPSFPAQDLLFFMDTAANEALRALNSANLRRCTELQCPKARRRRLNAVQRLVQVLLGDPNIGPFGHGSCPTFPKQLL